MRRPLGEGKRVLPVERYVVGYLGGIGGHRVWVALTLGSREVAWVTPVAAGGRHAGRSH